MSSLPKKRHIGYDIKTMLDNMLMHGDNFLQQQDDMLKINTLLHQLLHQNIKVVARENHESHQVKLGHDKMCWVAINIVF